MYCCCYRDTKMEIQGLSDAQNIHSPQHGASHGTASSALATTTGVLSRIVSNENEADGLWENDNNNNRPSRTSPAFRLLAENGSHHHHHRATCLPSSSKSHGGDNEVSAHIADNDTQNSSVVVGNGFRNVSSLKENAELINNLHYGVEIEDDNALQMAFASFFDGEEQEEDEEQRPAPAGLRQQREQDGGDCASLQSHSNATGALSAAPPGNAVNTTSAAAATVSQNRNSQQGLYVVFNLVQENGASSETSSKDPLDVLPDDDDGHTLKGKKSSSSSRPEYSSSRGGWCGGGRSMEADNNNVMIQSNHENLNCVVEDKALRKPDGGLLLNDNCGAAAEGEAAEVASNHAKNITINNETVGTANVLTNDYEVTGQICTQQQHDEGKSSLLSHHKDNSGSALLMSANAGTVESVDIGEAMDTNNFIAAANTDMVSTSAPTSEAFSGTIMINNQSIIVTIENGILTLAAPPEGYVQKDDDMISLKEHLGMKDHEDIVLLNYDSGTKSIGKISTLAVGSQHEEPRPALSISDTELALVDDCSLSDLGTSLDSSPLVKQEAASLCAIMEGDLVTPCVKTTAALRKDSLKSAHLIRSKKDTVVSFGCPEPDCSSTFDSRQKLKVHLLNHAEDPRPYQCTVEGCGWAFATCYKLKRHLQSHDKQRPHACQFEGCGRSFTTVYNLKAHGKVHDQENAFVCEICNERFRSATRLNNHQRMHFEPQRPYKCEFPGCEKTFITFSALFSHNRMHFKETGHFTCSYPGCDKLYDKACRLKIHMRSHTGERPFVCDSEGCGWTFTSMSKLLRHKRKHDDDRRFMCPEEGCGKSFTRAEHLKGHSITHLGTKPFQCHAEGCNAKFSARSSLYIHSKKHKLDASSLRTRCPVANCTKHFSSRSSLKSHMLKHHHLSADVLSQMETTPSLTPSSELISSTPTTVAAPGITGSDQMTNLDLNSLFSSVPGGPVPTSSIGVGVPVGATSTAGTFAMDLSLVSSGILTIDPSSVGTTLSTGASATLAKVVDPLILAAGTDLSTHHGLEGTVGDVLPPQGTLNLDDVQTVTPEALGTLAALSMQGNVSSVDHALTHPLSSSSALSVEPVASLAVAPVAELLSSTSKVVEVGSQGGTGPLLGCVEVLGPQDGGKVLTQFVFPGHSSNSNFSPQKDPELNAVSPSSFLESGGSARTDYRAIQLAKKKKQRGPSAASGSLGLTQRKNKGGKSSTASASLVAPGVRYGEGTTGANGGLTLRDPVTGAQYVQIQLLQDDPASDGELAFQLSSQPSTSHSQLTVDLPVNILQEPSVMAEDDNGSDNSQFTGSTINLQDLE